MTPRWGEAPWRIDVDVPASPLPAHADVAVIGAGFTGLSTAWHLARAGVHVVVLEAHRLGAGASGRTGGLALEGTARGPQPGADDCLVTLERIVGEAGIACDLRLDGCWEITHRPAGPEGRPGWTDDGSVLVGASLEPGGTVDPGALVSGLARAALAAGAHLAAHCPVVGLERGAPLVVVTPEQRLTADHVVTALNAYPDTFLPRRLPLRSALTLALATAPLSDAVLDEAGLADRRPFYTIDLPYLWGRAETDGRLVLGAGLVSPEDNAVEGVDVDTHDVRQAFTRLETRARGLHPAFAGVRITHRWGGPIAFRAERDPVCTRLPETPAVIVTGGYAGHGVALSLRLGAHVADAITRDVALPAFGALAP